MAVDSRETIPAESENSGAPNEHLAASDGRVASQGDYPALFRTYVVRGLRTTLESFDGVVDQLDEARRDRGLHLVSYGLRLDDAWAETLGVALALAPHLERQGYRETWMDLLVQALANAERQGDPAAAAQVHLRLGRLYILMGEYDTADEHLTQARQLAELTGDRETQAQALERLGLNAFDCSKLDAAQSYAEAALALALTVPDAATAIHARHLLAWVAVRRGAMSEGIAQLDHVLEWHRRQGGRQALAAALRDLGAAYFFAGRYEQAVTALDEAITLFVALKNRFGEAVARMNLGIAHWYRKDYAQALAAYAPCDTIFEQVGARIYLARLYNNRGLVYRELGESGRATAFFDQSIALARAVQDFYEVANALDSLAGLHLRTGDIAAALATWQAALDELALLPVTPGYLYGSIQEQMAAAQRAAGGASREGCQDADRSEA